MKTLVNRQLIVAAIALLAVSSGNASANSDHCTLTVYRALFSFIATTKDYYLHLIPTANEDGVLYVLRREQANQDKADGTFYYIDSLSSDCNSLTLNLSDDNDKRAILVGTEVDLPKKRKASAQSGAIDAYIEWWWPEKNEGFSTYPPPELIHFMPTSYVRLYGLGTDISAKEAGQIIDKTSNALCQKELGETDEQSRRFQECFTSYNGQMYIDLVVNKKPK